MSFMVCDIRAETCIGAYLYFTIFHHPVNIVQVLEGFQQGSGVPLLMRNKPWVKSDEWASVSTTEGIYSFSAPLT